MIWVCITFVISATSYSISYDRRECLRRGQRELCFSPGDHHVETEGYRVTNRMVTGQLQTGCRI